jgi:hypothetical protein
MLSTTMGLLALTIRGFLPISRLVGSCYDMHGNFFVQAGEAKEFCTHIKTACDLVNKSENSYIVFSGGQTKLGAGPISEAASYFEVSLELGLLNEKALTVHPSHCVRLLYATQRVLLEEYARDSIENLAFSVGCFYEHLGCMPDSITVRSQHTPSINSCSYTSRHMRPL